jgi:hypothetical protein
MKTILVSTALAAASVGVPSAEAGSCRSGLGYYGYSYAPQNLAYVPQTTWSRPLHQDWHDTAHLDYQPARVTPHFNHFDYQPGGYVRHQTGHYDLHR